MVQYNKTHLYIGGVTGIAALVSLGLAAYLIHTTIQEAGMGLLITGPLIGSLAPIGLSFAVLSAVYLITELSKCNKQKGNLYIGGTAGVVSLANLGFAAYLFCSTAGNLELLAPVVGSLVAVGLAFAILSTFHLTKALNDDKEVQSNITCSKCSAKTEEMTTGNGPLK